MPKVPQSVDLQIDAPGHLPAVPQSEDKARAAAMRKMRAQWRKALKGGDFHELCKGQWALGERAFTLRHPQCDGELAVFLFAAQDLGWQACCYLI